MKWTWWQYSNRCDNSFHALNSVNSLAPGKFSWNFIYVIFKQILLIDGWGISCEIGLIWMSLDFTDDQSTLVQVMAWCCQASSHYLSQCWPRSLSPYGVTRPERVNLSVKWASNGSFINSIMITYATPLVNFNPIYSYPELGNIEWNIWCINS